MKSKLTARKRRAQISPNESGLARTNLGIILRRIRAEIVANGAPLLRWSGLDREIAKRRHELNGEAEA